MSDAASTTASDPALWVDQHGDHRYYCALSRLTRSTATL